MAPTHVLCPRQGVLPTGKGESLGVRILVLKFLWP